MDVSLVNADPRLSVVWAKTEIDSTRGWKGRPQRPIFDARKRRDQLGTTAAVRRDRRRVSRNPIQSYVL